MKKITIIVLLSLSFFSCKEENAKNSGPPYDGFVELNGKEFVIKGEPFFPLMMNYIIKYREINNGLVVSPTIEYDSLHKFDAYTKESIHQRLHAHFQLLKEIGFNSIRLVGLNSASYHSETGELHFDIYNEDNTLDTLYFNEHKAEFLKELEEVIAIAKQNDLRVMILLPRPRKNEVHNSKRLEYIKSLLQRFGNEQQVFSYDFFNEPLYFDNSEYSEHKDIIRSKKEAYKIVLSWKEIMAKYAPNQLFTIGYAEPLEVFEWDPSILPVDFVSIHTYHPLRVPNEIFWYSNYIKKPWILGETSLPADNDSVSYLEQRQFMKEVLRRIVDCGGSGLGWWQFQDVSWGPFEHNYTPLLNHTGITKTKQGNIVYGSVKPAAYEIEEFKNYEPTYECICNSNYYNIVGYNNIVVKGKIINSNTGEPIEGAVIRGWNSNWGIGANTFTKPDGTFTLFSNDEFVHFEISAPSMSKIKFSERLAYKPANESYSLFRELPNKELEYHNIGYQHFLKYSDRLKDSTLYEQDEVIFNFTESLFDQYKFIGKMETKKLEPLDFVE